MIVGGRHLIGEQIYRDPDVLKKLAEEIEGTASGAPLRIMHVCGTHENAICKYALRELLPSWLTVVAGPGCPVCVCPPEEIDAAAQVALSHGAVVATFGDMVQVPGEMSLAQARAQGGRIRVVASVHEAVRLARENPGEEVVFFAVGFETTACTTAAALLDSPPANFSVLLAHRLIPPALEALLAMPSLRVDGFLMPGHVHAVIGLDGFDRIARAANRPMVVAGFEPADILLGLSSIASSAKRGEGGFWSVYERAVKPAGNTKARASMERVFRVEDARWRGLGTINGSGLGLRPDFEHLDAKRRFAVTPATDPVDHESGCRCGDVMVGLCEPEECGLFGTSCTPSDPRGACMVGAEGTCRARFSFGSTRHGR